MKRSLMFVALLTLMVLVVAGPATAIDPPGTVDIDSNGDCEIEGLFEEVEGANVHVAINEKWIVATCHVQLDETQVGGLGGPFDRAQVYRDFECLVGNDDDLEDVESTLSHLVVTPSGQLNVTCKAPNPGSQPE